MALLHGTNNYLVEKLTEAEVLHKFGSVTFSTDAQVLTPLEELTPETAQRVQKTINSTVPGGGTNILEGLRVGMQQQTDDTDKDGFVRVVFLFTDGVPTSGVKKKEKINAEVKNLVEAANRDVLIYTFAIGDNLEVALLSGIAEVGGGVMYAVSDPADMPVSFGSAIGGNRLRKSTCADYRCFRPLDGSCVEVELYDWASR